MDGPFNGTAPPPWSIPIQPSNMFQNHQKVCEVSVLSWLLDAVQNDIEDIETSYKSTHGLLSILTRCSFVRGP